jgi:hypothetical protein
LFAARFTRRFRRARRRRNRFRLVFMCGGILVGTEAFGRLGMWLTETAGGFGFVFRSDRMFLRTGMLRCHGVGWVGNFSGGGRFGGGGSGTGAAATATATPATATTFVSGTRRI